MKRTCLQVNTLSKLKALVEVKIQTIVKYSAFLSTLLLLTQCSFYSPSISSPVVIDKKGQVQLDGNISVSNYLLTPIGFHGSVAYGIADNASAQLSASYISGCNNEFGGTVGYYYDLNKNLKVGAFPGFNFGYVFLDEEYVDIMGGQSYTYSWRGNYLSPYFRLQFLFDNKYMTIGLGTKAGMYYPKLKVNNLPKNQNAFLLEPSIFIMPSLWNDDLRISINSSFSKLFSVNNGSVDYHGDYPLDYNNVIVSIGLNYRFSIARNANN